MTADVYAADGKLLPKLDANMSTERYIVKVIADADADVLLRIAAQLSFLNNVPQRFHFELLTDATVKVEFVVAGCSMRAVDLVRRKLEQLTSVTQCQLERHTVV